MRSPASSSTRARPARRSRRSPATPTAPPRAGRRSAGAGQHPQRQGRHRGIDQERRGLAPSVDRRDPAAQQDFFAGMHARLERDTRERTDEELGTRPAAGSRPQRSGSTWTSRGANWTCRSTWCSPSPSRSSTMTRWLHLHEGHAAPVDDTPPGSSTYPWWLRLGEVELRRRAPVEQARAGARHPAERLHRDRLRIRRRRPPRCAPRSSGSSRGSPDRRRSSRCRSRRGTRSPKTAHCTLRRSAWPWPPLTGQPSAPTSKIMW